MISMPPVPDRNPDWIGTEIQTNLGPSNIAKTDIASAQFTFTQVGTYRVCYQLFSSNWVSVSSFDMTLELSKVAL